LGLEYRFGATVGPFLLSELRFIEAQKRSRRILRPSPGMKRFQLLSGTPLG